MAMIERAFSLEIHDFVNAIEANELWMEGVLSDKKAFVCVGEGCIAGITCKNMDKLAADRKQIPHFIMSQHENMHSDSCEVFREIEEIESNRNIKTKEARRGNEREEICFNMIRPERHRIMEYSLNAGQKEIIDEIKERKKKEQRDNQARKINFYFLPSLVSSFVNALRNGAIYENEVKINFDNIHSYTYKLGYLFKRIENDSEITDKDKNHYVYFGKGRIFQRDDGGYDILFSNCFAGSDKKVKCVLSNKLIEECRVGRIYKLNMLKSAIGKERYIYVLSNKNVSNQYNTVYLNVKTLDCVAVSDIDVDETVQE